MGVLIAKFVKTSNLLIHSPALPQKTYIRSTIILIVMINVWFIYSVIRHVVNNIQVKLTTILEVSGTNTKLKLEKLSVVIWKMLSKSSYSVTFYNKITKVFLKMWKLGWLIKQRVMTQPRENFTGWELSKLCTLMVWILRVTISNFICFC